jgi:hypothetical protein
MSRVMRFAARIYYVTTSSLRTRSIAIIAPPWPFLYVYVQPTSCLPIVVHVFLRGQPAFLVKQSRKVEGDYCT